VSLKAIEAMKEIGDDLTTHTSKGLESFNGKEVEEAVTMGCGDECPLVLAKLLASPLQISRLWERDRTPIHHSNQHYGEGSPQWRPWSVRQSRHGSSIPNFRTGSTTATWIQMSAPQYRLQV